MKYPARPFFRTPAGTFVRALVASLALCATLAHPGPAQAADVSADDLLKQIDEKLKDTVSVGTCTWKSGTDSAEPELKCPDKLLISGDRISVIRVAGLPKGTVKVWVNAADGLVEIKDKPQDLSYDEMMMNGRPSALIEVHKSRTFAPTFGGWFGRRGNTQLESLRPKKEDKHKLAVVLSSAAQAFQIGVSVGNAGDEKYQAQTALVNIVYERWGFETGGFIAISNLSDEELVTNPNPNDTSKVQVQKVRRTDKATQETGVFLSLIPRNYPFLAFGLGFATNSGHSPSVYLGPSIRLVGLGNRGLASFSAGVVNRQVKVFPGVVTGPTSSYEQDSNVLKGRFESRFGGYFMINLGFTFGQIGGGAAPESAPK